MSAVVWLWRCHIRCSYDLQLIVEVNLDQVVLVLVRAPRLALDLHDMRRPLVGCQQQKHLNFRPSSTSQMVPSMTSEHGGR